MTEYYRTPDNEIRADYAYHIGLLLHQYEGFCERLGVEPADRFEITLQICLLQSLLTHCLELLHDMKRDRRLGSLFNSQIGEIPVWGITSEMIVANTFLKERPSLADVLEHIRHAVSHPARTSSGTTLPPTTGYSTQPMRGSTDKPIIQAVVFTHSPDVRSRVNLPPQPRVFSIVLPWQSLRSFVIELSNLLSLPTLQNWNGSSIISVFKD